MQVGVMPPPTVGYQPPHRQQQGLNSSNGSHDVMRNTCKVALIGSKVQRPLMNFCRKCNSPIIIHGRFIPCKHVMCVACAAPMSQPCPICNQKFDKIEQNETVYICPFFTSDSKPCERSYLSERDLVAHLKMRHQEIDVDKFSSGKPLVLPSKESYVDKALPVPETLPSPVNQSANEAPQNQPISTIGQDVDMRQNSGGYRGYQPRHFSPRGGLYHRPDFHGSPRGRGGGFRPRFPFRPRGNWNQ